MIEYATIFIILFLLCIFCVFLIFYSNNYDPKVAKIRRLGKRFKVVTGPQFSELYLTKEKKQELQALVENASPEVHEFIANANCFYFVIKHVFNREPQAFIFCSQKAKKVITSEMTHNSSCEEDFLKVPLEFNQLYRFLYNL